MKGTVVLNIFNDSGVHIRRIKADGPFRFPYQLFEQSEPAVDSCHDILFRSPPDDRVRLFKGGAVIADPQEDQVDKILFCSNTYFYGKTTPCIMG